MQNLSTKVNQKMFTQEEVNNKIRKRLVRKKRQMNYDLEQKLLKIEVLGKLEQENIPLEFVQFIMVSKNASRTYQTLERFITTWHNCVHKK